MLGLHSSDPNHCVCNGTHKQVGCWCDPWTHIPVESITTKRGGVSFAPQPTAPTKMYTRKTTNHAKHIIWGFLTGGIWWVTGYPICVLLNRRARSVTVVR